MEKPTGQSDQNNRIDLIFGGAGHEGHYVLTTRKSVFESAIEIPEGWEGQLIERLGKGWGVEDRGNRVEIRPPGGQTDEEKEKFLRGVIEETTGISFEPDPTLQ